MFCSLYLLAQETWWGKTVQAKSFNYSQRFKVHNNNFSIVLGNNLLRYLTFDTVHNFLLCLSLFQWHRSTVWGVAAISLKEGQLGIIVEAMTEHKLP